jgi:hypothetical protein
MVSTVGSNRMNESARVNVDESQPTKYVLELFEKSVGQEREWLRDAYVKLRSADNQERELLKAQEDIKIKRSEIQLLRDKIALYRIIAYQAKKLHWDAELI